MTINKNGWFQSIFQTVDGAQKNDQRDALIACKMFQSEIKKVCNDVDAKENLINSKFGNCRRQFYEIT